MKLRRLHLMTQNEIAELKIQVRIFKHIDDFKSFRFNAGAGAGKTYTLIETLKYVTINKIAATKSPQKIACITYTNVAVNEIQNRLGNSDVVHVSTIHEILWEIIKKAQPELLICHKDKIKGTIERINTDLMSSGKTNFFNDLDELLQEEFIEFAMQTKDLFYQSKKLNAALFKNAYNDTKIKKPDGLREYLKNVTNFQYTVALFYKKQQLETCLEKIVAGTEKRVNYDSKANLDRLHYMKFSHDTLLEYSLKLIETYPTLSRIIIDSYPYFFIDEYQDTHNNVIKFIKAIHEYATQNNKKWMVGYFGDTAQSIYDNGVGRRIVDLHDGLINIDKIFNRRSHQQIIDVANNIRADEIIQKPIFHDKNKGSTSFFYNTSEDKLITSQKFLSEYKNDLIKDSKESGAMNNEETKIHCLVLTNKLMASFNGFSDVYEVYQNSGIYYDNLNTQVLSKQLEKLHPTILNIYHFIKLYQDIQKSIVSYYDIFGSSSKNMAFSKASMMIRELEEEELTSLKDWVILIIGLLENSDIKETLSKALINRVHYEQDKLISADVFQETWLDSINTLMNVDSEDENTATEKVNSILTLPIKSLVNWVNFIDGIEVSDISYHTYHGTKGEEYKNVAIILEHNFGIKNKDKFKNYFKVIQQNTTEKESLFANPKAHEKHINTQNLLYVACSRAVKNLRVLYLDDISEIQEGIDTIFGKSKYWPISEDPKTIQSVGQPIIEANNIK